MIKKDNISLRAVEPSDADFLFSLENDQRLWHLSNTLIPFSRFDIEQYILLADKDPFVAKQLRLMVDMRKADSPECVGTIDLFNVEAKHRRAGIGITVIQAERGKGIASSALELMIDYAFNTLGLHQLYCNIEADNEVSIGLFEKYGFQICGTKLAWNRRDDGWVDEHMYQLINNL